MPRLTEQEQQEIVRFIEADRPLPDKYRFLLFEDKREVELVWNGKSSEVCNIVLPFQVIEQVDEPRAEKPEETALQMGLFSTDERGRQLKGWTNKLIWGDNKLILSSLKNGPLREEIEKQGGLKLIYIDPPFDVGADFSMDIEIGGDTFTKKPNILEEIAYRDTWGKGADSFIAMIYERLLLMRDLLTEDGSIYVHCDWHVGNQLKLVMDEVFGRDCSLNEITWQRTSAHGDTKFFGNVVDTIHAYARTASRYVWNQFYVPFNPDYVASEYRYQDTDGRRFRRGDLTGAGTTQGATGQPWRGLNPKEIGRHWARPPADLDELDKQGKIYWPAKGKWPHLKVYLDESQGARITNLWIDIPPINNVAKEGTGYATQKPEALIERIIKASSNEGDLVADFFCGSGTTAAVAEKLGRDLSPI